MATSMWADDRKEKMLEDARRSDKSIGPMHGHPTMLASRVYKDGVTRG